MSRRLAQASAGTYGYGASASGYGGYAEAEAGDYGGRGLPATSGAGQYGMQEAVKMDSHGYKHDKGMYGDKEATAADTGMYGQKGMNGDKKGTYGGAEKGMYGSTGMYGDEAMTEGKNGMYGKKGMYGDKEVKKGDKEMYSMYGDKGAYGDKAKKGKYGSKKGMQAGMKDEEGMYGGLEAEKAAFDRDFFKGMYGEHAETIAHTGMYSAKGMMKANKGMYGEKEASTGMYGDKGMLTADKGMYGDKKAYKSMYGNKEADIMKGTYGDVMAADKGVYGKDMASADKGMYGKKADKGAYGEYADKGEMPAYGDKSLDVDAAAEVDAMPADEGAGTYASDKGTYGTLSKGAYEAGDAAELAGIIITETNEPIEEAVEDVLIAEAPAVAPAGTYGSGAAPAADGAAEAPFAVAPAPAPFSFELPEAESDEDWNCFCDSENAWLEDNTFFAGCIDEVGAVTVESDEDTCIGSGHTWISWACGEMMDLMFTYEQVTCAEPGLFADSVVGLKALCCNDVVYEPLAPATAPAAVPAASGDAPAAAAPVAAAPLPASEQPDWACACKADGNFVHDASFYLCEDSEGNPVDVPLDMCTGELSVHTFLCGATLDGLWLDFDITCDDADQFPADVTTAVAIGCCDNGATLNASLGAPAVAPAVAVTPTQVAADAPAPVAADMPTAVPAAAPVAAEEAVVEVEESPFPSTTVPCGGECIPRHQKCSGEGFDTTHSCCDPDDICMKKNAFHWQCVTPGRYERKISQGWEGSILTCAA